MVSPINIALTGLKAAEKRAHTAAHNIANATTPKPTTFEAVQTSVEPAGVNVRMKAHTNEGVALHNITDETINLLLAETDFKANAAVIRTADDMDETLFDLMDRN